MAWGVEEGGLEGGLEGGMEAGGRWVGGGLEVIYGAVREGGVAAWLSTGSWRPRSRARG